MPKKRREPDTFESLLEREIQINGLSEYLPELKKEKAVLNEISFTLRRHPHEGKLPHFGAIFLSESNTYPGLVITRMPVGQLDIARTLADGIRSFVVFEKEQFSGLGMFINKGLDEYLLIEYLEISKARCIITGDTGGVTKIYSKAGVIEHHLRRWYQKQSVLSVLSQIERAAPQAPILILYQVLAFALHLLSPRKIGATLVVSLRSPSEQDLATMKPQIDLSPLQLKLTQSDHRAILRHCLSQVDGATLFGPDGIAIGTGAQLKCSDNSISLIRELSGTRHTSAKRFSYDYAASLVITVSADGPVTVFSDGVNLAEIYWRSAETAAEGIRKMLPHRRDDVSACEYSEICPKCGKTSIINEVTILGYKEREVADCPVCGSILATAMCHTLNSQIRKCC